MGMHWPGGDHMGMHWPVVTTWVYICTDHAEGIYVLDRGNCMGMPPKESLANTYPNIHYYT